MRSRHALLAALAVTLWLAGGCGGDGGEAGGVEAASDTEVAGTSNEGESSAAGNYAVVTIGGTSYEVPPDPINLCNSLPNLVFGSFAVDANGEVTQAGGTDASVQINFGIPAVDWEAQGLQPPTLNVDLKDDGIRWFASVELGAGSVDSWELSDGLATGSATMVSQSAGSGEETGSDQATFEIVCR